LISSTTKSTKLRNFKNLPFSSIPISHSWKYPRPVLTSDLKMLRNNVIVAAKTILFNSENYKLRIESQNSQKKSTKIPLTALRGES